MFKAIAKKGCANVLVEGGEYVVYAVDESQEGGEIRTIFLVGSKTSSEFIWVYAKDFLESPSNYNNIVVSL